MKSVLTPFQFLKVAALGLVALVAPVAGAAPFAYIANQGSNNVSVIDIATNTVVGSPIAVGAGPVCRVEFAGVVPGWAVSWLVQARPSQ